MRTLAILVAAGRGERLGAGRPKAFVEVGGRPMLLHAAEAFGAAPSVDGIVVVVPGAEVAAAEGLLARVPRLMAVTAGGARRQDSVLEGLKRAPDGFDGVVLVHDAARPFVEVATIEAVARAAREHGAAVPLLALTDTIKRVRDGCVIATVDREELAGAQTPQGFGFGLLVRAYEQAFRERVALTDESLAVERIGATVRVVPGSSRNRKLTTPEDLAWAEALLAREGRAPRAGGRAASRAKRERGRPRSAAPRTAHQAKGRRRAKGRRS